MAKHKKKRSAPTPDPQNPKSDIPETEDVSIQKEPSAEPPKKPEKTPTEAETVEYKKKLDKLYWMRVILAVIAGSAATFIFEPMEGEERRWASIGFMIVLFFITIIIGKSMRMQLPSSDRKKLVTQAIGSYVFLYLFMWIVTYTLINISSEGGIPSPIP